MPDTGKFEFDFVAFDDVPTKDQESSEQEIIALKQWFLNTIKQLKEVAHEKDDL